MHTNCSKPRSQRGRAAVAASLSRCLLPVVPGRPCLAGRLLPARRVFLVLVLNCCGGVGLVAAAYWMPRPGGFRRAAGPRLRWALGHWPVPAAQRRGRFASPRRALLCFVGPGRGVFRPRSFRSGGAGGARSRASAAVGCGARSVFVPAPPFALRRAVFCACWSGVLPCLPPAPAAPAGGSRGAQGCAFGCFCLVLLAAIRRGVFCFRAFALCAGGATFQGAGCSAPLTFANTCVSMIWQGCAAPIWGPLREGCPGCSKTRLDLIQAGFFVPAFRLLRSSAFHFSPI